MAEVVVKASKTSREVGAGVPSGPTDGSEKTPAQGESKEPTARQSALLWEAAAAHEFEVGMGVEHNVSETHCRVLLRGAVVALPH